MTEPWKPQSHPDAHSVLSGLVPTHDYSHDTHGNFRESGAFTSSMLSTMPILLAGSMAVSMTFTGAVAPVSARPSTDSNAANGNAVGSAVGGASSSRVDAAATRHTKQANNLSSAAAIEPAPGLYTVVAGDTVSDIAARFGLSTASVLALNGLGWKSIIFAGQTLRLTSEVAAAPRAPVAEQVPVSIARYTIVRGDTISHIAERFGVSVSGVLEANGLSKNSLIFPGQTIVIPVDSENNPSPVPATDALGADSSLAPVVPEPVADESGSATPANELTDSSASIDADKKTSSTKEEKPASNSSTKKNSSEGTQSTSEKPTPESTNKGSYVIKSGDTLSKIAASFGISVKALCDANGLTTSSVIYAGKKLAIPGGSTSTDTGTTTPATTGQNVTLLTAEGEANARVIISIGRELGVSDYGIVIALATAMQESTMRNLNYGHLDSVGLFQQRPASGWGTPSQLTTPSHAARLFYGGPKNPNKGKTRGLLDIAGWQSMTVTQAAQKVQISAYPNAYAKWETSARYWLKTL